MRLSSIILQNQSSLFVLTDSGGIREEAAAFGKPVLVLRNHTRRTKALRREHRE